MDIPAVEGFGDSYVSEHDDHWTNGKDSLNLKVPRFTSQVRSIMLGMR